MLLQRKAILGKRFEITIVTFTGSRTDIKNVKNEIHKYYIEIQNKPLHVHFLLKHNSRVKLDSISTGFILVQILAC